MGCFVKPRGKWGVDPARPTPREHADLPTLPVKGTVDQAKAGRDGPGAKRQAIAIVQAEDFRRHIEPGGNAGRSPSAPPRRLRVRRDGGRLFRGRRCRNIVRPGSGLFVVAHDDTNDSERLWFVARVQLPANR